MAERGDGRYLTTEETAQRLDVKPETVYAYVSRGLLTSVRTKGRRGSLFDRDEVDRLRERGHTGRREPGVVEHIHSELTQIDRDRLYYRRHPAIDLAARPVESVAYLLWTGELTDRPPFPAPAELVALARGVGANLPGTARLTDHLRVVVAALGAADPLRFDLGRQAVLRVAERLLGVLGGALPGARKADSGLAERLWPALSDEPACPDLLNTALVLLVDHGLAVSTVAARVAASARAHLYAVVSAGLGAADGPYHGAASTLAYRFLAEAADDPIGALSERLRTGEPVPGFGHRVYQHSDPRADLLLELLRDKAIRQVVDTISAELADRSGLFPNIDLALAAMMHAYGMRPDAGEAVFELARTIGWIAHALEEYAESPLRFRPSIPA